MNSIMVRRSIRKYQKRAVEEQKVHELLKAALSSPTARNQREWEFVVVTDKEILKALSECSPYAGPAAEAPLAIIPVANEKRMKSPAYFEQDLAATTENILIEAVVLGLGGLWMGIAPKKERMDKVSEVLHLPEHTKPFAIISIGYPAEERIETERYEEERIHYNQY